MSILPYRKFKGLEIRCLKCNKTIHRDSAPKGRCKHPIENTAYRAIVILPDSGGKRCSKTLLSRTYNDAIKELIDFRSDVINGNFKVNEQNFKPQFIKDCMAMYLDYISDVDIPDHLRKNNSEGYINTQRSLFKTFLLFLDSQDFDSDVFKIGDVNESILGKYHSFLMKKTNSNYSFNHHIKIMRALYSYLKDIKGYQILNPFLGIKLRPEKGNDFSISSEDFNDLLNAISPIGSTKKIGKKTKRNMYKDWLTDAIKLKAYTGRRNEEIFQMRWNMIYFEGETPIYIVSPNLKINRLLNQVNPGELDVAYIPIIEELETFLKEKGLESKRNTDEYIIAPQSKSRILLEKQASKSLTFFCERLNRDYKIQMKSLRSTYVTSQEIYAYQQGQKIQQHTNFRITNKHYINQKVIAKYISKDRSENRFVVFPQSQVSSKTTQ